MRKNKTFLLVVMLGAGMILSACGKGSSDVSDNGQAASGKLQTVTIGASSQTARLSECALLAQNLGYIDEELEAVGYKPEYVGFVGAGPAINEAFAAGELDYAFYVEFPVITANSNGVDVTVIAAASTEQHYALLASESSGIKSGADIAGKKIIVTPGTILYKYFSELCEKYNISVDDVEIVNALSDAQVVLKSGDADGLIISYGGALMYGNMGLGNVVEDTIGDADLATGLVLAGRADYVEKNPEVDKALVRALYRAYQYAQENPDKVYALLETEASPVSVLKQTYAYDTSFEYFNPTLTEDYLSRAESVYDFADSNNLLGSENVDMDKIFDNSYVEAVIAENE